MYQKTYEAWLLSSSSIKDKFETENVFKSWQDKTWRILKFGYGSEDRAYHDFDHINDLLHKYELIKDKIKNPVAFVFAIWFHDVVYNPLSQYSERDSAGIAYESLVDLDAKLAQEVYELVLFTSWRDIWFMDGDIFEIHRDCSCTFGTLNEDFLYLRDIDWSGFGSEWENYSKNTRDIFMESPYQSYEQFCEKRVAFLEYLKTLQKNHRPLFCTEHFNKLLTEKANENIDRELKELKER